MSAILTPATEKRESRPSTPPSLWTLPGVVAVVALFDLCFWERRSWPGLSLAVFFAGLVVAIAVTRTTAVLGRRGVVLLALLAGTIVEAGIETGFCNGLMLLALTAAFSAETFFVRLASGLRRWLAQMMAFVLAPFRAIHLLLRVAGRLLLRAGLAGRMAAAVVIAVPTLALLLLFGTLLANGNAVFALWTRQGFDWLWRLLPRIDFARVLLWTVVGTGAVSLLWPSEVTDRPLPGPGWPVRWPELLPPRLALWTSAVLLAALNAMFVVANIADAVFLWRGGTLPAGVTYSAFVHQGVELLIVTALLSALVLATVFNQGITVAGQRALKTLGMVWLAQNLFLILSTTRRLELYITADGATVQRFSTLLFLLLVTTGFGLLGVMIVREKTLAWLVGRSAVAAFATLYLVQFLNLVGWVADYDVARWDAQRWTKLDVLYLESLGPAAWPALARVQRLEPGELEEEGRRSEWDENPAEQEKDHPATDLGGGHWREFSARAWWNRKALDEWSPKE